MLRIVLIVAVLAVACVAQNEVITALVADGDASIATPDTGRVSPFNSDDCSTNNQFVDKDGDDCTAYEADAIWCNQAQDFVNASGKSATTECCVCKLVTENGLTGDEISIQQNDDGTVAVVIERPANGTTVAETLDPTGDRSYGIEGCKTDAEFKDADGDDCTVYESKSYWCATSSQYPNAANVTANEACCVCKSYAELIADIEAGNAVQVPAPTADDAANATTTAAPTPAA